MKKFLIVAFAVFAAPMFSFAQVAPATASISAAPATILKGQSTTITWASTGATYCSIASSRYTFGFPAGAPAGSLTITPASSVALTLTCLNSSGVAATAKTVVGVMQPALPAPTATISASSTTINVGESTTVTWSSTNATYCSIGSTRYAFPFGSATSGSLVITPASSVALTLTCANAAGVTATAKTIVGVMQPVLPAPTATISASSTTINAGESTTITWSSTNATSCSISSSRYSFPFGNATSGSLVITPASSVALTLTCSNSQTSAVAKTTVGVMQPVLPAPVLSFTSSLPTLFLGDTTTISWSATGANACWITSSRGTFPFSNATSGSLDITPSMTTVLTLSCSNSSTSSSMNLTVPVI